MVKFSIIMPVVDAPVGTGRVPSYLDAAVKSVFMGGYEDFELLLGCDGSVPAIAEKAASYKDDRIKYHEFPFTGHWGNPQRNRLQKIATGTHINYLDHDDVYVPGALASVAEMAECFSDRLLVYQLLNIHLERRWERRGEVKPLFIGGQMMVIPNDGKVPEWLPEDYYSADLNFCKAAVKKYMEGGDKTIWVPEVIQQLRPWALQPMQDYKHALDRLRGVTSENSLSIGIGPARSDGSVVPSL